METNADRILTIGHSTRSIDAFLELLQAHAVRRLVDVRTVPRSRHNPQFEKAALAASVEAAGILYSHLPGLGGLRQASPTSVNTGWRNASFRGYADHMQTKVFREDLDLCVEWSQTDRIALMCAEAVPWRCHRSLIADALIARGIQTSEISSRRQLRRHVLTPWARVEGSNVTYPPDHAPDSSL